MKHPSSVLMLAAALAVSPFLAISQTPAPQQPGPMHHEMPKPSNLQVLPKDISTADLIQLMRGYSAQLGVECSYCHAKDEQTKRPNFASDANPEKATARIMISMTENVNRKYLTQIKDPDMPMTAKVECGTCHRGHAMPETYTPPAESEQH